MLTSVPANAAGWTEPLTITLAFVEDSEHVVIYTSVGIQSTPGYVVDAWISWLPQTSGVHGLGQQLYRLKWEEKKIKFWVNDTCASWNYHKTNAVMLLTAG